MPVKFKAIAKGQPGVAGGGVKKYYASPIVDGELDLDGLTKEIEKICTVSGADIRSVLYALVDVSVGGLDRGAIVRLGELGSLRVSLHSEGVATEAELKASSVKKGSVIYTPGKRITEMLKNLKFVKAAK